MLGRALDCEFESRQEQRENLLLRVNFVCCLLFGVRSTPRVTTVAHKRPGSFCQKCKWQITPKHTYTLDRTKSKWADHAAVQAWCGNLSGNELTRNSSGNTRLQSSQLTQPMWTDPSLKSGICVCKLFSTKKKFVKCRQGMNSPTCSPKSSQARKKPPPPCCIC